MLPVSKHESESETVTIGVLRTDLSATKVVVRDHLHWPPFCR